MTFRLAARDAGGRLTLRISDSYQSSKGVLRNGVRLTVMFLPTFAISLLGHNIFFLLTLERLQKQFLSWA